MRHAAALSSCSVVNAWTPFGRFPPSRPTEVRKLLIVRSVVALSYLARCEGFPHDKVAVVHAWCRVVQQGFLMGHDLQSGKNCDHCKIQIEAMPVHFAMCFGIDLIASANVSVPARPGPREARPHALPCRANSPTMGYDLRASAESCLSSNSAEEYMVDRFSKVAILLLLACGPARRAEAALTNVVGTSEISASASVTRGGSGETDGFSNTALPETGSGGLVGISYVAEAGPVPAVPGSASFPGTAGMVVSAAEATVDFTIGSTGIGLDSTTVGQILSTDPAGIDAGYSANNSSNARIDFEVDQTTTVRLLGTATHTSGAFWQIQLGGGAIASNYFSSTPGTEVIDDLYVFEPGFTYFIRALSDADIGLEEGAMPTSRTSSISLNVIAIPEPSTLAMTAVVGSILVSRRRRPRPFAEQR